MRADWVDLVLLLMFFVACTWMYFAVRSARNDYFQEKQKRCKAEAELLWIHKKMDATQEIVTMLRRGDKLRGKKTREAHIAISAYWDGDPIQYRNINLGEDSSWVPLELGDSTPTNLFSGGLEFRVRPWWAKPSFTREEK